MKEQALMLLIGLSILATGQKTIEKIENTNQDIGWTAVEDIEWSAYESILSENDYAALQEYFPVLSGEETFEWTFNDYSNDYEKHIVTLDEFRYKLNNEIFSFSDDEKMDRLWINSFTICDLGQDGSKELILLCENAGGHFLILHKENEKFYGIDTVYRGFLQLQTNGVYQGSGGAAYSMYFELEFENGAFNEKKLGYTDWDDEQGKAIYYMGNEMTEDYDIFKEWLDSYMVGNMEYYEVIRK